MIGKPFKNGGRGPEAYDCWGLVREIYRRLGVALPEYLVDCFDIDAIHGIYQKERHGAPWLAADRPRFPDLAVFRFNSPVVNHVGVYLGGREFIHARQGANVCIESLEHIYWKRAIESYYRWGGEI